MHYKSDLIWNNGMVRYDLIVAFGVVAANSVDDDGDSRSFSTDMHDLTV